MSKRIICIAAILFIGAALAAVGEGNVDTYSLKLDRYSMPAVLTPKDFYSLSRHFVQGGNSIWKADNYKTNDLERVALNNQEWVRWHFIKKTAITPALAYSYASSVDPVRFSLRALNRGKTPIAISGAAQADAPSWITLQPGEERPIETKGQPTLHVQGTEPDVEYDLYMRDLSIFYPEAEGVAVTKLEAPGRFAAGQKMKIDLAIEGGLGANTASLEVRHDPYTIWRIRLSDEERQGLETKKACAIEREVPWYLPPGEATVGLVVDGLRAKGAEARATIANKRRAKLPHVERRVEGGRPTFFVDGKPFIWSGYATYNFSPQTINEFAASGANLFHIVAAAGRHYHNACAPTWMGGDEYDFGEVEQWATTILQANPDAKMILRLALGLPPFWFNEHLESLARIQTTDGREMVWEETQSRVATMTSEVWRKQQAVALRKLIQYCASRPWASQVIGFNLGGGMTEEWFAWASCDDIITPVKYFSDYSVPNQEAFRKWCAAKKYPFDRIPDPNVRKKPGHYLFPDDENGRWAAAYNEFINEETVGTLKYFAAVVKDETHRRSLVGAFFGYVVLLTGEARQSNSGQFGLRIALESEDIDFFGGVPQHYLRRLTGDGYAQNATACESILAHGKQYVDDNDLFSWLHEAHWHTEYDANDPRGGCIQMHRRWLSMEAIHGNSNEWFSLSPKWHHDKGLMDEFALEGKVLAESLQADRTPIEETAFVIDDRSFAWLTPEASAHYSHQVLLGTLGRTGASMGVWIMSDLDRLPDRVKFVVVINASAPRKEDLKKLKKLIERGGRTILVVGTPGLVDEKTQRWNLTGPEELLGLPIRIDSEPKTGKAVLASGQWLCPVLSAMNPEANPIGDSVTPRGYMDGEGFLKYKDGKTAGAERPLAKGGKLIWCGVPPYASDEWMREKVVESGAHSYAPAPCSAHATKDLVSITSVYADDRDIETSWPQEVIITDVFDGWRGQGKTITCPFKHGQTRLFKVTVP